MPKKFLVWLRFFPNGSQDLPSAIAHAMEALVELNCLALRTEEFPAGSTLSAAARKALPDCDIILWIVPELAKPIPAEAWEALWDENQLAREKGLHSVALAAKNTTAFRIDAAEMGEALITKIKGVESLLKGGSYSEWSSAADLGNQIRINLPKILTEGVLEGWRRADSIGSKSELAARERLQKMIEILKSQPLKSGNNTPRDFKKTVFEKGKFNAEFSYIAVYKRAKVKEEKNDQ